MKKNWLVIAILTLATQAAFAAESGFMTADDEAATGPTFSCNKNDFTEKAQEAAVLAERALGVQDIFKKRLVEKIKPATNPQTLGAFGGNSDSSPNVVYILSYKGLLYIQMAGISLPAKACADSNGLQVQIDATKNTLTKGFGKPLVQLQKINDKSAILKQVNGTLFPAASYDWAMR